ncbi:hypothetical protein B2J93_361 [Marssonina coronariae]|uniref:Rhodopsin domain-containing protein n=1 Tax=Diplocarpon coronariae TaxID=2795749 RepID=A0A218Z8R6_9HELO|nr:hypothetical protein B2J93_361 [Marssonina coronariae]
MLAYGRAWLTCPTFLRGRAPPCGAPGAPDVARAVAAPAGTPRHVRGARLSTQALSETEGEEEQGGLERPPGAATNKEASGSRDVISTTPTPRALPVLTSRTKRPSGRSLSRLSARRGIRLVPWPRRDLWDSGPLRPSPSAAAAPPDPPGPRELAVAGPAERRARSGLHPDTALSPPTGGDIRFFFSPFEPDLLLAAALVPLSALAPLSRASFSRARVPFSARPASVRVAMPLRTQGTIAVVVSSALALVAFVAIATRMYIKLSITKNFGWNDVGMFTALAAYMALLALLIDGCINGIGGHTALATIPGITSVLKASIAITMMRWTSSRVLKLLFWGSIGMDVLISSIFTFYVIFQCTPISYAWEMLNPKIKGKCLPFTGQLYMGLALCFVTFALDVLLMTSPFIMMKGRGLNKILKRYIYGIFSLGIAATIANIIRLFAIFKLQNSKDQLYDAAPVFTWSAVEVSIGIIIAGLIEMGPLMAKWGFPGFDSYNRFASLGDEDTVKLQRMQSMDKTSIVISNPAR